MIKNMPDSCCDVGCTNRWKEKGSVKIFHITSEKRFPERRKSCVAPMKREKWTDKMINSENLCSEHFISGSYFLIFV